jgi:hypothetical protein
VTQQLGQGLRQLGQKIVGLSNRDVTFD